MLGNEIKKIKKFEEIDLKSFPSSTIALIDLDDTTFSGCQNLSVAKWFYDQMSIHKEEGYTTEQAKLKFYQRWIDSQATVPTKLVDSNFPTFLEKCKSSCAITIGLTARQPEIAEVTYKQLK